MSNLIVKKISPIYHSIKVPGDKSISHRAILISSLSNGTSRIYNFLTSEDCLSSLNAMKKLGVDIKYYYVDVKDGKQKNIYFEDTQLKKISKLNHDIIIEVMGKNNNFKNLKDKTIEINCGNSGTTMRLISGILSAQNFSSKLVGDESLSSRPMKRIIEPLKKMGAQISGTKQNLPPLKIKGNELKAITYKMPVASAQVKSSIMLAALFAEGNTIIQELHETRNHTEKMFEQFGIKMILDNKKITVFGNQTPQACDVFVPGDISSAAFWIGLATSLPGSKLIVKKVGINKSRSAFLKVLIRMGASIKESIKNDIGEKYGHIEINSDLANYQLKGTTIKGEEIANLIDELPILAIVATQAEGKTTIKDAKELRVKETDRISSIVTNLRLMGAKVEEFHDGFSIYKSKLKSAKLNSYGDHRIAMAFSIAGLLADGQTTITNSQCIDISYPGFKKVMSEIIDKYQI